MLSNENRQKGSKAKSVSKTLAILSTFNKFSPMQRTSDIAAKLQMNISTVSRHLNTMLDWGFLERDDVTGLYYPGIEIIALAGTALQNNEIFRHASPELQQLSYKYGVHSYLSVPRTVDIVYLISCCCENTMDLLIPIGYRHPMYCSAMGRAMLAYMTPAKVQKILAGSKMQKYTSETKVTHNEIRKELIHTRRKGYCLLVNELVENHASLATPIIGSSRTPIAAISVSESASDLCQPQREREIAKAVMSVAGTISGRLGYHPK